MIDVNTALQTIQNTTNSLPSIILPLSEALGYYLSEDIFSPIDMPPFDNSAMDGYAINEWDTSTYTVITEIQAGVDASNIDLEPGQAARIFTGAMVPNSATTVIRQESTTRESDQMTITEDFKSGANIRKRAEQISSGNIALKKGTALNAAAIGFLGMLGIQKVNVHRKPIIKLLVTGNELVEAGQSLQPGQIYESNAVTIISALAELGFNATSIRIKDDKEVTIKMVGELLQECDVLLTSGGISVGEYDFIGTAMEENGIKTGFYKIKQKPGKPLFYGYNESCHVFALPGNPASALTCTYIYVYPALQQLIGCSTLHLEKRSLELSDPIIKRAGLTHYLKGSIDGDKVAPLNHQSSSMLDSFAASNCLIIAPEEAEEISAGTIVSVYILPK